MESVNFSAINKMSYAATRELFQIDLNGKKQQIVDSFLLERSKPMQFDIESTIPPCNFPLSNMRQLLFIPPSVATCIHHLVYFVLFSAHSWLKINRKLQTRLNKIDIFIKQNSHRKWDEFSPWIITVHEIINMSPDKKRWFVVLLNFSTKTVLSAGNNRLNFCCPHLNNSWMN